MHKLLPALFLNEIESSPDVGASVATLVGLAVGDLIGAILGGVGLGGVGLGGVGLGGVGLGGVGVGPSTCCLKFATVTRLSCIFLAQSSVDVPIVAPLYVTSGDEYQFTLVQPPGQLYDNIDRKAPPGS
jgi:hypothetical protein